MSTTIRKKAYSWIILRTMYCSTPPCLKYVSSTSVSKRASTSNFFPSSVYKEQSSFHHHRVHYSHQKRKSTTNRYLDSISRLDIIVELDSEALFASQAQCVRRLTRQILKRSNAHPDQVTAMNTFITLGNHRSHTLHSQTLKEYPTYMSVY